MLSPHRQLRRLRLGVGFTLIEMMVVIAIIVGVLAMAVPLVNALTGKRSLEAGYNLVSAAITHARQMAIYNKVTTGAFFYIDPATGRTAIQFVEPPTGVGMPTLDFAPGGETGATLPPSPSEDTILLPQGVGARVLNDNTRAALQTDQSLATGAILFDQYGNLLMINYNVPYQYSATGPQNALAGRIQVIPVPTPSTASLDPSPSPASLYSLGGVEIYDRTSYLGQPGFNESDIITANSLQNQAATNTKLKGNEESWLNQNATLAMVRSGDGALVKGK